MAVTGIHFIILLLFGIISTFQVTARTSTLPVKHDSKILQGHCGSCWAFGAVESLSDRFCIHFGMNISLSVNDLLSCCGFKCGDCDGGHSPAAWRYLVHHGVVTDECDPYFGNTGCTHPGWEPLYPTPKCKRKCVKKNLQWRKSKHFSVTESVLIRTISWLKSIKMAQLRSHSLSMRTLLIISREFTSTQRAVPRVVMQ